MFGGDRGAEVQRRRDIPSGKANGLFGGDRGTEVQRRRAFREGIGTPACVCISASLPLHLCSLRTRFSVLPGTEAASSPIDNPALSPPPDRRTAAHRPAAGA